MINSNTKSLVVAGLRGSSGKTILSIGLAREWHRRGLSVAPFKKGPDYIDSHWLTLATGVECRNLDVYLSGSQNVLRSFIEFSREAQVALIEGNRGIFDGMDEAGSYSTAELAKLLKSPTVLIVDCTKTTRTVAALVAGCKVLDPDLDIAGVVLNRVANTRHGDIVGKCIEGETGVPVVGCIPKLRNFPFPERHLGLVMPLEHNASLEAVDASADLIADCVDVDALWDIAGKAGNVSFEMPDNIDRDVAGETVKIGVIRDAAFSFYYPENIEQLQRAGAEVVEIDSINDSILPQIDALYIGGGFPETLAQQLVDNKSFRMSVREAADSGLPIYAECGGAMYLGESILYNGTTYPMVGALPISYEVCSKPQGHGYTELEVELENPFYDISKRLRGHEFHYSKVLDWNREEIKLVAKNVRGCGFDGSRDGVCKNNILALYSHTHDLGGNAGWGCAMVKSAIRYARRSSTGKNQQVGSIRVCKEETGLHETAGANRIETQI